MGFINKILKKRQLLNSYNSEEFETVTELESGEILQKVEKNDDELKIVLCTQKSLSEEQKNTIISIVKDGIVSNQKQSSICIKVLMQTGVGEGMIINRINNCIQVII